MNNDTSSNSNSDAQSALNHIVLDYMKEKKRTRRMRWFKRTIILLIVAYVGYLYYVDTQKTSKPHVGIIDIEGEIADSKSANADDFAKGMQSAYKNKQMKALVIRVNSPGGSPVQAEYMYNIIKYQKKTHPEIKIYAVCMDLCASAAYYLSAAADEIYASPASMVGSIGVIYNGFGFVDTLQKLGVSRRLQTAGVNKGFMDPFSPESPEQTAKLQTMLDLVHNLFIKRVKEGRGSRLNINDNTFSGLIWTGEQAYPMGLIDGFASAGQLARDIIKIDKMVDYTSKPSVLDKVSTNLGAAIVHDLLSELKFSPSIQ